MNYHFEGGTFLPDYLIFNDKFLQEVNNFTQDHITKLPYPAAPVRSMKDEKGVKTLAAAGNVLTNDTEGETNTKFPSYLYSPRNGIYGAPIR